MQTMLESKEFFSAGAYHAKVKTPLEMIASAVRATDARRSISRFRWRSEIGQLGEPLYRKIEPTGYSTANAEWVSSASLLGRMNFALDLTQNKVPGVKVDPKIFPDRPAENGATDAVRHGCYSADPRGDREGAGGSKRKESVRRAGAGGGAGDRVAGFSEEIEMGHECTRMNTNKISDSCLFVCIRG